VDPGIGSQGHFLTGTLKKRPALFMKKRCPQNTAILQDQKPFKSGSFRK
jgi:hypothetical protein